jgi:hypothetical protein
MGHHVTVGLCGRPTHPGTLSSPPRLPAWRGASQSGRRHCKRGRAFRARERGCAAIPGCERWVSRLAISGSQLTSSRLSVEQTAGLAGGRERRATGRVVPAVVVAIARLLLRFDVCLADGGPRRWVSRVGHEEGVIGVKIKALILAFGGFEVIRSSRGLLVGYRRGTILCGAVGSRVVRWLVPRRKRRARRGPVAECFEARICTHMHMHTNSSALFAAGRFMQPRGHSVLLLPWHY